VHEAGHAVMAYLLGMVPAQLAIHEDGGERAGSCHTQDFRFEDPPGAGPWDRVDVALAGVVAEMIACGETAWDEDSRDLDRAVGLLMGRAEDCDGVVRELEAARERVRRRLGERWDTVLCLAAALDSRGRLGRDEILGLLERDRRAGVGLALQVGEVS